MDERGLQHVPLPTVWPEAEYVAFATQPPSESPDYFKKAEADVSKPTEENNIWLREPGAAHHVGLARGTLAKLRCFGGGARFSKVGRAVIYRRDDLDAWLKSRQVASTSE